MPTFSLKLHSIVTLLRSPLPHQPIHPLAISFASDGNTPASASATLSSSTDRDVQSPIAIGEDEEAALEGEDEHARLVSQARSPAVPTADVLTAHTGPEGPEEAEAAEGTGVESGVEAVGADREEAEMDEEEGAAEDAAAAGQKRKSAAAAAPKAAKTPTTSAPKPRGPRKKTTKASPSPTKTPPTSVQDFAPDLLTAEDLEAADMALLPPELQTRVALNKDKIAALLSELSASETFPELSDADAGLAAQTEMLIKFITSAGASGREAHAAKIAATAAATAAAAAAAAAANAAAASAEPTEGAETSDHAVAEPKAAESTEDAQVGMQISETPAAAAPEFDATDFVVSAVRGIIAACIEGRSEPLAALVQAVAHKLEAVRAHVDDLEFAPVEAPADGANQDKDAARIREEERDVTMGLRMQVLAAVGNISDEVVLAEEVKSLGERLAYGAKPRGALPLLDATPEAVWRFKCNSLLLHPKEAQGTIKDARANRKKFGEAVKALHKLTELLLKQPLDQAAFDKAENVAFTKTSAIEKAKAARGEAEVKKVRSAPLRARKAMRH